ncbi:hypothetical protein EVAR_72135_1 [Eumeta japonica]|uniref:Uncharacterized protein n=1 Tax=Eumeta variegata TaxID=151549 RepID=A0A4C1TJU9_EUMVA|nr:hypothetical protein EVAR_72135_1 [Eumeta japonica]
MRNSTCLDEAGVRSRRELDSLKQRDRENQRKISTRDTDEKEGHLPDTFQLRGICWRKLSFVSGVLVGQWGHLTA